MATRAPRPCIKPGCPHLSRDGTGYCDEHHAPSGWKEYSKESRHKRGYGTRWDKLRIAILKRDKYLCQPCLKAGPLTTATQVDHIIPKSKGGTDNPLNLQAICTDCHRLKSSAEGGAGQNSG